VHDKTSKENNQQNQILISWGYKLFLCKKSSPLENDHSIIIHGNKYFGS